MRIVVPPFSINLSGSSSEAFSFYIYFTNSIINYQENRIQNISDTEVAIKSGMYLTKAGEKIIQKAEAVGDDIHDIYRIAAEEMYFVSSHLLI